MSTSLFSTIQKYIDESGASYVHMRHPPTSTSAESAAVRGEPLEVGGKAILLKTAETYRLFVLSARLRVNSSAIKRHLHLKSLRFATEQELLTVTGLVPGSVPPFGRPILPFDLFVDPSILRQSKIAFNAGSLTDSIVMSVQDYVRLANPTVFALAADVPTVDQGQVGLCDEISEGRLLTSALRAQQQPLNQRR